MSDLNAKNKERNTPPIVLKKQIIVSIGFLISISKKAKRKGTNNTNIIIAVAMIEFLLIKFILPKAPTLTLKKE